MGAQVERNTQLAQALEEPQVQHREMLQEVEHPTAGPLKILRNPIRYSETPIDGYTAPPTIGQHTDNVLAQLGYKNAEIDALRSKNVI